MFFRKKKPQPRDYDREHLTPVLRCSICTGEETAGFRDNRTGHFTEVMLIRSPADLEQFRQEYGVESVQREY